MTEQELASAIGVSLKTIENILADRFPESSVTWGKFAVYFRKDGDFLRTGGATYSVTILNLSEHTSESPAGHIRRVPLLNWHQMSQMVGSKDIPHAIHAEATIETTNVLGKRTVAVKVKDDSMEPQCSEGEIIFVNPDGKWKPGDYVIANFQDGQPETILLKQVKSIGSKCKLHPLNRKYEDLPLTKQGKVWGKVVRLRKNL